MKPEEQIEGYLVKQCKAHDFLCYKFISPSTAGVPDRIVIGNGYTVFVELKAPRQKPRPLQKVIHKQMRDHGALVYVIDTKEQIDGLIKKISERQSSTKRQKRRRE